MHRIKIISTALMLEINYFVYLVKSILHQSYTLLKFVNDGDIIFAILSIRYIVSGESKVIVLRTWVWPLWNKADPCKHEYKSFWHKIGLSSLIERPSTLFFSLRTISLAIDLTKPWNILLRFWYVNICG